MFVKANISWNVNQLAKMLESGKINLNAIVQRSFKWEVSRKSLLIHSIMTGYPIPPFYTKKEDGIYYVLDGKQRINAVTSYRNNEFALTDIPSITLEDGTELDVNGKTFSELPEDLQDTIKSYSLLVYYFDGINEEEVRSMFKRLNNGKPLTAKERAIANCADIETLMEIGQHEFFSTVYSEKAIAERKQVAVIAKMYMMLYMDLEDVSFNSKDINNVMENMSISDTERDELLNILDRAKAIYDICVEQKKMVARRFGTETHFVSLVPFLKKSIEEGYTVQKMAKFAHFLFDDKVIISEEYTALCQSGSNKNTAIVARNDIIGCEWAFFFEGEDEEDYWERVKEEKAEAETETVEEPEAEQPTAETETTADEQKTYRYGMRLRGCAPGCQPDGFLSFEEDADGLYQDILVYDRELTDEELMQYELDKIQ